MRQRSRQEGVAGAAQMMNKYPPRSKSRIHMTTCGHRPHTEGKKYKCMALSNWCDFFRNGGKSAENSVHDQTMSGGYQLSLITLV